jgi:hypothetical protein
MYDPEKYKYVYNKWWHRSKYLAIYFGGSYCMFEVELGDRWHKTHVLQFVCKDKWFNHFKAGARR